MSIVTEAKKIDKEFIQEEKQDDKHVKAIEKDLKKVEKKESSLAKEASKAEKDAAKRAKEEHKTAEKLNDAIHAHENASIALQRSKEEVQSKQVALGDASRKIEKEQSLLEEALRTKSTHVHEHAIKRAELSSISGGILGSSQEPTFAHGGDVQPQQTQSHVGSPLDNKGQDAGQSSKVPGACQDSHIGTDEGAQ